MSEKSEIFILLWGIFCALASIIFAFAGMYFIIKGRIDYATLLFVLTLVLKPERRERT